MNARASARHDHPSCVPAANDYCPPCGAGALVKWLESNSAWIAGILIAIAYGRILAGTVTVWSHDENYTHGFLVAPLVGFFLWSRRAVIADAAASGKRTWLGIVILIAGLLVMFASDLLQIPFVGYWSLPVTIAGAVIALAGVQVWKIVQFPVIYLLVAAPIPDFVFGPISGFVQRLSSSGAAFLMKSVGYPLALHGNLIELPGITLEVADVCSGFKKMIALVAFALLFGFVSRMTMAKRVLLVAAAVPIAIAANILRIAGLIAVASAGGDAAVKFAHDWAELAAIIIACILLIQFGKALGCPKSIRSI